MNGEERAILRALLDHHEDNADHEYGDKYNCERPQAMAARKLLGLDDARSGDR